MIWHTAKLATSRRIRQLVRVTFLRASRDDLPTRSFAHLDRVARLCAERQRHTLSRQIAIAEIAAPTGHESVRGNAIRGWLGEIGLVDVRRDAVGNVIAHLPASGRARDDAAPVVVLAHLDTVCTDNPLPPARREGDRIVLPGIGDNGRGLAALLALADLLRDDELHARRARPIELVATVGEEGLGDLRGVRGYFDDRSRAHAPLPHAVVALDGPGDALIVHHAIASRRLRVSFSGAGGHPWADADATNAIHVAGRAIADVARMASTQARGVTVTVTRMGGGESLTSVPAHAWFDVDLRALDASVIPQLDAMVHRLAERATADVTRDEAVKAVRVRIERLGDRPGGALDAMHPLVRLASDATRWLGREPQSASASSDANLPLSLGVPSITIGAGGVGGGAHTEHEWYVDTEGAVGMTRALAIVSELAREPNPRH
jgi:acetylornithine deacetylase/succinyl-diaminopimelate desuccinylase-like protein